MLAELHVHLEGSVEPETLLEIDPSLDLEEVRADFDSTTSRIHPKLYMGQPAASDTRALCADHAALLERLAAEDVEYAEIILSVGVILWKEQDFHAIFDALVAEASQAPLQVRWVFDAIRQFGADGAMRVAELAVERKQDGVVASESAAMSARSGRVVQRCVRIREANGLALVPHAGETDGPASVWACVNSGPIASVTASARRKIRN